MDEQVENIGIEPTKQIAKLAPKEKQTQTKNNLLTVENIQRKNVASEG